SQNLHPNNSPDLFKSDTGDDRLPQNPVGGGVGKYDKVELNEAMVILPSIEKVQNISGVLDILIQRSTTLKAESNTLINLRDTLLPQLISGKIRLNQPEDAAA
ncbi:restriction endonuclease subunit S, partial [Thiolapillus sp.]|uniref:restriction endonuclease subunit S n=1 Tax=Thiolapillus sp. TaxID=2017437 RepID=UPI003AF6AEDF